MGGSIGSSSLSHYREMKDVHEEEEEEENK